MASCVLLFIHNDRWSLWVPLLMFLVVHRARSSKSCKPRCVFFFLCALDVYYSPIATFNWFVHHSKHIIFLKNAFCDLSELVSFPSFFLFYADSEVTNRTIQSWEDISGSGCEAPTAASYHGGADMSGSSFVGSCKNCNA